MRTEQFASAKRAVYARSPFLLGKDILGFTKFCETQIDWDRWARGIFSFAPQSRAFAMKLAPRETFKSTFFVVTLAIHALLQNPNLTILIAAETQGNADAHLKEIKGKIESDAFKNAFGDWTGTDVWRDDAINIHARNIFSKEASIETAGIGKSLTGKHYDLIICDDIVGSEDRDSPAKRTDTFRFFNDMFDVLKKENGQLLMVGTRWHREDLYNHVLTRLAPDLERKGLGRFHVSIVPAHEPDGTLNYPRLLPEHRLSELKTVKQGKDGIDISTYMAQYELNPLSPEEQIFKNFHYVNHENLAFERFVLWTDPALSKKESACYSASVALAKVKDEAYWLALYASIKRRSPSEIVSDHNRIFRMLRDLYKAEGDAYMEDNGFQILLTGNAISASITEKDPVPTVGRTSTENKIARIRSMEPYVTQGFIRFRADWATAPEGYALLIEQLSNFPQGLIDAVDALQCAHKQTQESISFRRV